MNTKNLISILIGFSLLGSIWFFQADGKTFTDPTLPKPPTLPIPNPIKSTEPPTENKTAPVAKTPLPKTPIPPKTMDTPPTIEFQHTTYDLEDTLGLIIIDENHPAIVKINFIKPNGETRTETFRQTGDNTGIYQFPFAVGEITDNKYGYLWAEYTYQTNSGEKKVSTYVLIQPSYSKVKAVIGDYSRWSPQIDTKIFDLVRAPSPKTYAAQKLIPYDEKTNKVRLVVEFSDPSVLDKIKDQGGIIEFTGLGQTQITFPVDNITKLGDIEGLKSVFPPTLIHQHEIISEGVAIIQADQVHSGGYTGKGVKVAVLDMAFDVNNQEIKNNIKETKQFRKSFDGKLVDVLGNDHEYVHGTAVAEIITDVAPDVQLYLYTIGTEIEFQNAIDNILARNDIDILTMSAGWVNQLTDGKSPVTNKLSKAASKIPTIISAGNYRQTHWEGNYDKFSEQVGSLSIPVEQNRGYPIWVFLMWNDSSEDYNMILKDSSGKQVDISTNRQYNGYPYGLETISYDPQVGGHYTVEISFAGQGIPRSNLEIFSTTEQQFSPFISQGSSAVPTDASNVITVGAVDFQNNLEDYSSEGPTNNGNVVPEIMAPDGVSTLAYDGEQFFGTSAAAPHVAGIAALFLEKNPDFSRQEIVDAILENADDSSIESITGNGIASAAFIAPISSEPDPSTLPSPNESENNSVMSTIKVPEWVKQQTKWWVDNAVSDNEFVQAIQYLMKNNIIIIPNIPESANEKSSLVPEWVRTNARWWTEDKITDTEFAKGLEFLVKEGIIRVK